MATPIRSPISPMSGHSPATRALAIRTGSWLAPEARPDARRLARLALGVIALACALAPPDTLAARHARSQKPSQPPAVRHLPYPELELPFQIGGGQYAPVAWSEIAGWNEDDHLAAYKAFRVSCRPISAQRTPPADPKALGPSLRDPCQIAKGLEPSARPKAKGFFEEHFLPFRISRLGEGEGFVTGYYEPIVDGSKTENEGYKGPGSRPPAHPFLPGPPHGSVAL